MELLQGTPGRLRVKVCCIASTEEADMALAAGADALGLVSAMPSGPGVVADDTIDDVIAHVAGRAATVLLTSRLTASGIEAQLQRSMPSVLQLTDRLPDGEAAQLRARFPLLALMPVIHVGDAGAVQEAREVASYGDAVLLDSGNPLAAVKELGGTGRTHDWVVSRAICEAVHVPVFLAGGLRPDNVASAVRAARPRGVDVCSGVRRNGKLDEQLVSSFIAAARAAVIDAHLHGA